MYSFQINAYIILIFTTSIKLYNYILYIFTPTLKDTISRRSTKLITYEQLKYCCSYLVDRTSMKIFAIKQKYSKKSEDMCLCMIKVLLYTYSYNTFLIAELQSNRVYNWAVL